MDEDEYRELKDQLYPTLRDLWFEFKNSNQEPWSTLTMIIDDSGKFETEHCYDNLSESSHFDRRLAWKYKHLGLLPVDDYGKKSLNEYLKKKDNQER